MDNIEHSTNFFLQVSSFTRHLLDDILPVEVCNKPDISSDFLENIIKECDALIISLQNFKMRTNATQINEIVSLTDGLAINVQFNELCKSIMEKIVTISDLIKYKPFYCRLCNFATWQENLFNEHSSSLKHVEQTDHAVVPYNVFKCQLCHLVLIAPQSEINSIKLLSSHGKLDEHVRKLKETNEKGQGKSKAYSKQLAGSNIDLNKLDRTVSNVTKSFNSEMTVLPIQVPNMIDSEQSSIGPSITQSKVIEAVGNDTISAIPQKVKQALKLMRKKLRVDNRLPDTVLHYCNVCDIVVNSNTSYIQHNSSKQHISAINNAIKLINLFKCERCKILITGYPDVIEVIVNSDLHREIDEWVNLLQTAPVQKSETSVTITPSSSFGISTNNSTSFVPNSVLMPIPYDLKYSLIFIYDNVTTANLKKHSPSYCFVCERNIDSFHNFQQHIKAKQHKLMSSTSTQSHSFYQCTVCLLTLFGTECEISNTVKSSEHVNLDKKINNLLKDNIKNDLEKIPVKEKVSKEKSITPPVGMPKVSKSSEAKSTPSVSTNKNVIPTKFFTFNAKLLSGCFTKSGFCKPCNKGVIIKNGWAVHMNCKKHIVKTIDIESSKNLIPLQCKFCPLQILGDQLHGNACMDAHMKLNHPDSKNIEIRNDEDIATDFNLSSVITTQQFINSNIKNDSNNLVPNRLQETINSTETQGTSSSQLIMEETKIKDAYQHLALASAKLTNIPSVGNNSKLDIFIKILMKKKTLFLDEGSKQFVGICLICSLTFYDYYSWLIHIKGTTHRDMQNKNIYERECKKCNLSLYGDRSEIDDKLWQTEEHQSLDILISQ